MYYGIRFLYRHTRAPRHYRAPVRRARARLIRPTLTRQSSSWIADVPMVEGPGCTRNGRKRAKCVFEGFGHSIFLRFFCNRRQKARHFNKQHLTIRSHLEDEGVKTARLSPIGLTGSNCHNVIQSVEINKITNATHDVRCAQHKRESWLIFRVTLFVFERWLTHRKIFSVNLN